LQKNVVRVRTLLRTLSGNAHQLLGLIRRGLVNFAEDREVVGRANLASH
jgi:hypothetical protein